MWAGKWEKRREKPEQRTKARKRKKGEAHGQPQPIEEKRQGRHGKRRQTARTARKRQRKNCNMQSWERAQPLSPFEVSPDGTGRRFCLENSGWRDPLGYHNAAKYPPADFFIDLVLCVVGRFACQVPNLSATRTAIPERFSGGKLPQGILCPENRRLERAGIRPPSYLLDGTW